MTTPNRTIVVIGGVAGGASAAARARRCNEAATIILYEKDAYVSFANCGLPYYLGGEIADRAKLLVSPVERFKDRFNIDVHTRHEVLAIDRGAKTVTVVNRINGETLQQHFDKLILAPGAAPIRPELEGIDAANVFTLRNLEDTDAIQDFMKGAGPGRAIVVGAGFIGLEMAEQLHRVGWSVDLVELSPQVLPPLDPEMAKPVQIALEQKGVRLHLGKGLKSFIPGHDRVQGIVLDGGAAIEGDLVLLGMGVRPSTQLAAAAGLELGPMGGICINEFLQTSDPDIYAVGDAVEYTHTVLGTKMRVPLAGPANRAGRLAGEHAATGRSASMAPVAGTAIVRVFHQTAALTGLSIKGAARAGLEARSVTIAAGNHAGYYPGASTILLKLVYAPGDGRILGAQAVGEAGVDKRIDVIATAIHFGGTVRQLAGVDLAYAPPFGSAKDPVHMAAFAACNDLDDLSPLLPADADLTGLQILDVRMDEEVKRMRLPGAIALPVDGLRKHLDQLDPARPTVVLCHSGMRAHVAARLLKQSGFEDVSVLSGGMLMRRYAVPESVIPG
ncbi:MAG: FAD-dependent oxidoreductase [Candidatus Hydrogenedentes bacterium]|nr:FAD-dependent oxidoreductase [Candidatus Hydrogenedentota bacterium]